MKEVRETVLDALDKMHNLILDKEGIDEDDIKIDIAIANTTSQLAKAYIASLAIECKINNATKENKIMLEETL